MIKLIFLFFFVFSIAHAKTSVDTKITKVHYKLSNYSKNYSNLNQKMSETAQAILNQKQEIKKQQLFLDSLRLDLSNKGSSYKKNKLDLLEIKKAQQVLQVNQNKTEEKLMRVISRSISLSIILEDKHANDVDSIMEAEILKIKLKNSKNRAKKLNRKFYSNSKNISILNTKISNLELAIKLIERKKEMLISTQKKNIKMLKKLRVLLSSYKNSVKKILKKQDAMKRTLAKLNIIKIDEIKKAKEKKVRELAFASKKAMLNTKLPKVKKHGSSYQNIKTKRYRGAKTIAPLKSYTITKKYGSYVDPIYDIKIFNESITMQSKIKNAKVRTVFNGKVIYASKTPVLNYVVIVEHKNGLHTIYANLSKISPHVHKGVKIKKGYSIGRVKDELVFEVTQKSYHINPIRLFK